jgi:hypothetical protein
MTYKMLDVADTIIEHIDRNIADGKLFDAKEYVNQLILTNSGLFIMMCPHNIYISLSLSLYMHLHFTKDFWRLHS